MPQPDQEREAMLMAVLMNDRDRQYTLLGIGGDLPPPPIPPLKQPGGGGSYDPMERRVTSLETHMEYVRADLHGLKAGQERILAKLSGLDSLATKTDLRTFRWQWLATAVAGIALIVGGIIGGLGWIKPDASPPSPVVVQMPAPPGAPVPANPNGK